MLTNAYIHAGFWQLGDHAAITANWWRMAFVSQFVRYSRQCKSSMTFAAIMKKETISNAYWIPPAVSNQNAKSQGKNVYLQKPWHY